MVKINLQFDISTQNIAYIKLIKNSNNLYYRYTHDNDEELCFSLEYLLRVGIIQVNQVSNEFELTIIGNLILEKIKYIK